MRAEPTTFEGNDDLAARIAGRLGKRRANGAAQQAEADRALSRYAPESASRPEPLGDLAERIRHLPDGWQDTKPAPRPHVIRPYYPRGCVATVLGTGTASKTLLLCEQAVCITLGEDWREHPTEQGDVCIMTWEDGVRDYQAKLYALVQSRPEWKSQAKQIRERLHILDLRGTLARLVAADERGRPSPTVLAHNFAAMAREQLPDLRMLFVETVSRANACDETNEAHSQMVAAAEVIAVELDIGAGLVHHVSKAAARAGITDALVGRGGGALVDNARATTVVTLLGVSDEADKALLPKGMSPAELQGREIVLIANPRASYAKKAEPLYLERVYADHDMAPHLVPLPTPEPGTVSDRATAQLTADEQAVLEWLQTGPGREWQAERAICERRGEFNLAERSTKAALARLGEKGKLLREVRPQYGDKGRVVTRFKLPPQQGVLA